MAAPSNFEQEALELINRARRSLWGDRAVEPDPDALGQTITGDVTREALPWAMFNGVEASVMATAAEMSPALEPVSEVPIAIP
jgi:hypothetical protein